LIGVIAFVPASIFGKRASAETKDFVFHIMIPSFACGALLATTVFLLIPEALVLLSGGHEEEHDDEHRFLEGEEEEEGEGEATWKFGISVLAGYFIPFIFSGFFPHSHVPEDVLDCPAELEHAIPVEIVADEKIDDSKRTDVDKEEQFAYETAPDYRLAASILAGDFFHNFADGVFIGSAFLLCDRNLAIIVTATTVFHELSQELADYFLLTNQCHFPTWKALAFNFVSGFSVMLGVIVIFSTEVSNTAIGVILAMSAGVYFYVALTECAPRVNQYLTSTRRRACSFLFWVLGAVPIGLVLLNHAHCEE
jgi:zinc transporter ZupT